MSDYNPSVHQYPRTQHAPVIPERRNSSILKWLESTGRLISRETDPALDEADSEEISDLMGNEDNSFEEADDSDDSDDDD
ncbi:MAG: DUF3134 domain-containing protein [Cyanobacteria bacterium J06626_23]